MHIYTLTFWPHPWKHCNSGPILLHIGIWISSSQTLVTSSPIFTNIGILTISFQTLEFWPFFFYKHWNSYLIHPQIGISGPIFYSLEFSPHPSEHLNSGPILTNTGILMLSFHCKQWNFFINTGILTLFFQTLEFLYFPSKHWNSGPTFNTLLFDLILQDIGILALFL